MMSLKNILLVNGVSSGATGVLLVAFARFFANLFLISSTMTFTSVGVFLIAFAAVVILIAMGEIHQRKVQIIIAIDVLWVVISFIVSILFYDELSLIGSILIEAVALWVAAMAFLQTKNFKQAAL